MTELSPPEKAISPPAREFSYELKVPKDRIAVLIGVEGKTKSELERDTRCRIKVDSEEGEVTIYGSDALNLYILREVIKAIGRGFNPDIAKLLLNQNYLLEIIQLNDYSRTTKHQARLKGRVIGEGGKARRTIEELTGCYISVYGKTISIIGGAEALTACKRAIENLLNGSPHSVVYRSLEKQRKALKQRAIEEEFGSGGI
jgi:ribosomal RNA assembly protein